MRYNIKRLFNEVVFYQRELAKLKKAYDKSPAYGEAGSEKAEISTEMNRIRHAKSLCTSYIGQEVIERWKEGKNLNYEVEDIKLDI